MSVNGKHVFTDTGGGSVVLSLAAAQRLGVELRNVDDPSVLAELGSDARRGLLPVNRSRPWLALPDREEVFVIPDFRLMAGWPVDSDGVLGQSWFHGRVWTWDYPTKSLWLRRAGWTPADKAAHSLAVTFKNLPDGTRELDMPRTRVVVDGAELSVLLDTGATTVLKEHAIQLLGDGRPAVRATSMVGHRRFEEWRRSNPGWRVVEDAQVTTNAPMILVPLLEVGGFEVRDVWFTERPDRNFDSFMSSMTDAPVEAAVGGNVLRGFVLTIDYPNARAWLEAPRGGDPAETQQKDRK